MQKELLAHPVTSLHFQTWSAEFGGKKGNCDKGLWGMVTPRLKEQSVFSMKAQLMNLTLWAYSTTSFIKHTVGFQQALSPSDTYWKSKGKASFNDLPLSQNSDTFLRSSHCQKGSRLRWHFIIHKWIFSLVVQFAQEEFFEKQGGTANKHRHQASQGSTYEVKSKSSCGSVNNTSQKNSY